LLKLTYIHIPKEKRSKLDPSRKKGFFVGYSKTSKGFRIYIPGSHQIEISRDVTFDEDATFIKSKKIHVEEVHEKELVAPRVVEFSREPIRDVEDTPKEYIPKKHDMIESQEPAEPPPEKITRKEDQHGLEKVFNMQKGMALQKELSEKVRDQSHTLAM